ncbi:MAG TPA: hypothetical protein VNI52_14190 [Sphingobacteriaceae bacterium]|nr:hypothetical protein [Sphingobacteriaceae bacterium]
MNFLSHFYFDRNCKDPDFVMGSVLPDLVKNTRKDWHFHPEKDQLSYSTPKLKSLLSGWKRHLEVDKHFHSSRFFSTHTSAIRTAIAPVLTNSPVRPSFVAHIALELMLDSLLLAESKIDVNKFYASISLSDRASLYDFLTLNKADDPVLFFNFLDEFIQTRYLHSYREAQNIMYAINRICLRIWPEPMSETQKLQLNAILPDYQHKLENIFMDIFTEIDARLQESLEP